MFSKGRINDPINVGKQRAEDARKEPLPPQAGGGARKTEPSGLSTGIPPAASKIPPSILSSDLTVSGDLETDGDMQVEGVVEGNVASQLLTVGESATIRGEVRAEDVLVNGRVSGTIRARKVRLSASAHVEGDIIHGTIAIEAGARFEGSVNRSENPLGHKPKASPDAPGVASKGVSKGATPRPAGSAPAAAPASPVSATAPSLDRSR